MLVLKFPKDDEGNVRDRRHHQHGDKKDQEAAVRIMLEEKEKMEKKKLKILEWRKRYDWLQEGKLAEVLARLEIASVMEDQMEGAVESETNEMDVLMDEKMDIGYEWLEDG